MGYRVETVMPREALPEVKDLFNTMGKIPPDKLHGFLQFMCGVGYGLDMAGKRLEAQRMEDARNSA